MNYDTVNLQSTAIFVEGMVLESKGHILTLNSCALKILRIKRDICK